MNTAELAKKVRHIEITTRKAVTATFAGEYRSAFKGRGMEFDEVREYQMGDDIRTIDWNVTARTGGLHTKRFVEERELSIMLLVDMSASGTFGSRHVSKNEVAAEVCALLAFSAIKNNDRAGMLIFTDRLEMFVAPRKGATHVLRLIREALAFEPRATGTNLALALDSLSSLLKRRSVVFLISDFLDSGYQRTMAVIGRRHDLIAVTLSDPLEKRMPNVGLLELRDAENGHRRLLDTGSARERAAYLGAWSAHADSVERFCSSNGIDHIRLLAGEDYVKPLSRFFMGRSPWGARTA
jgi:uncharacterized protein (DUF58 family)